MNIEPNWTITNQGPWQLIYNDTSVISLAEAQGITSTDGKVFAGTREECEAEFARLGLPLASEITIEPQYYLIHDGKSILHFSFLKNEELKGILFIGTQLEGEVEIARLGLTWPEDELPANE